MSLGVWLQGRELGREEGRSAQLKLVRTVPVGEPLGPGRNHLKTPGASHWVRAMSHFTQSGRFQRTSSNVPRRAFCQTRKVLKPGRSQRIRRSGVTRLHAEQSSCEFMSTQDTSWTQGGEIHKPGTQSETNRH